MSSERFARAQALAATKGSRILAQFNAELQASRPQLRLSFTLPAGSYATVLLAEVMKCPLEPEDEQSDGTEEE